MLLLTSAPTKATWKAVLISPDDRVLWAILATAALAAFVGLWLRNKARE